MSEDRAAPTCGGVPKGNVLSVSPAAGSWGEGNADESTISQPPLTPFSTTRVRAMVGPHCCSTALDAAVSVSEAPNAVTASATPLGSAILTEFGREIES